MSGFSHGLETHLSVCVRMAGVSRQARCWSRGPAQTADWGSLPWSPGLRHLPPGHHSQLRKRVGSALVGRLSAAQRSSPLLCSAISGTPWETPRQISRARPARPRGPPRRPSAPQSGSVTQCSSPRRRVTPRATRVPSVGLHASVVHPQHKAPHVPHRELVRNQKGSDEKAQ